MIKVRWEELYERNNLIYYIDSNELFTGTIEHYSGAREHVLNGVTNKEDGPAYYNIRDNKYIFKYFIYKNIIFNSQNQEDFEKELILFKRKEKIKVFK